jgi:hypothetical protein
MKRQTGRVTCGQTDSEPSQRATHSHLALQDIDPHARLVAPRPRQLQRVVHAPAAMATNRSATER